MTSARSRSADFARELAAVAGPPQLEVIHRVSEDPQYLTDNPQRRCPDLRKLRSRFPWTPKLGLMKACGGRCDLTRRPPDGTSPAGNSMQRIAREEYEPFADLRHLFWWAICVVPTRIPSCAIPAWN